MKESRRSLLLAVALTSPCAAAPTLIADVAVSTGTHYERRKGPGLLGEGKPLEVMVWGGSGAIAGSLAGPLGTAVGAGIGALCGLLYSQFVVPHNGP